MTDRDKKMRIEKQTCDVYCQGCGKRIYPMDDLTDVEYVKTKRGSEWFFHTSCMGRVWAKKIR